MPGPCTAPLDATTVAHLQQWCGRGETWHDQLHAAPLRGLSATLDRDDPLPAPGSALPPLGHWLYFLPTARQSELGADGHPRRGGFLPPVPLPRRMWAGGRLAWQAANPLRMGQQVERLSTIRSIEHKAGRSGELLFVRVEHQYHNARGLALTEEQDIVYRSAARPGDPAPPSQTPPQAGRQAWSRTIVPDDVLLFRYSALTFNGHRIHYDRDYCIKEESYSGLLVHGPLQATLMLEQAAREMGQEKLKGFDYRGLRPLIDGADFTVHTRKGEAGLECWVCDKDGYKTFQATAS